MRTISLEAYKAIRGYILLSAMIDNERVELSRQELILLTGEGIDEAVELSDGLLDEDLIRRSLRFATTIQKMDNAFFEGELERVLDEKEPSPLETKDWSFVTADDVEGKFLFSKDSKVFCCIREAQKYAKKEGQYVVLIESATPF